MAVEPNNPKYLPPYEEAIKPKSPPPSYHEAVKGLRKNGDECRVDNKRIVERKTVEKTAGTAHLKGGVQPVVVKLSLAENCGPEPEVRSIDRKFKKTKATLKKEKINSERARAVGECLGKASSPNRLGFQLWISMLGLSGKPKDLMDFSKIEPFDKKGFLKNKYALKLLGKEKRIDAANVALLVRNAITQGYVGDKTLSRI